MTVRSCHREISFWVFIVLIISGVMFLGISQAQTPPLLNRHQLFTDVLLYHVHDGLVDYEGLCRDDRFSEYLHQLSSTDPGLLTAPQERLAFWVNVYNAYTLDIICKNYPLDSINELHPGGFFWGTIFKRTIWDQPFVDVSGKKYTLNQIEHNILRKEFKEPRVHFAFVCATRSCPVLRFEAYEGRELENQFEEQSHAFFNDSSKNSFDVSKRTAYLSPILGAYKKDFG